MARASVDEQVPIPVRDTARGLGALIAAGRRDQGMTQAELARRVGVKRATIGRIEAGSPGVAVGWVLTAAWILGLPILRSSDFASARSSSTVGAFLEQLDKQLPRRVRPPAAEVDDDF